MERAARTRKSKHLLPVLFILLLLVLWEVLVRINDVPSYILPAPTAILKTFFSNFGVLLDHSWTSLFETLAGLGISLVLKALCWRSLWIFIPSFAKPSIPCSWYPKAFQPLSSPQSSSFTLALVGHLKFSRSSSCAFSLSSSAWLMGWLKFPLRKFTYSRALVPIACKFIRTASSPPHSPAFFLGCASPLLMDSQAPSLGNG